MGKNSLLNIFAHGISLALICYLFIGGSEKVSVSSVVGADEESVAADALLANGDINLLDERLNKVLDFQEAVDRRIEFLELEVVRFDEVLSLLESRSGKLVVSEEVAREAVLDKYGAEHFERSEAAKVAEIADVFEENFGGYPDPEIHEYVGTILKENVSPNAVTDYECRSSVCKIVLTDKTGIDAAMAAQAFIQGFTGQMTVRNKSDGSIVIFARN